MKHLCKVFVWLRNVTLFLFTFSVQVNGADSQQPARDRYLTGLTFKSYDVSKEERTSLDLLPEDDVLSLDNGGSLHFNIRLYGYAYGSVVKIVVNDSTCLSLASMTLTKIVNLILTKGDKNIISEIDVGDMLLSGEWINVSISLNPESIHCVVGDKTAVIDESMGDFTIDHIFFGANSSKLFYSPDVPHMTIREIVIKDEKDRPLRYWPCFKHNTDVVYDEVGGHVASVSNAVWEVNSHALWKKEMDLFVAQTLLQIATDTVSGQIFVATQDSVYVLDINDNSVEQRKVTAGRPFQGSPNYLIYNQFTQQLVSYKPLFEDAGYYDFATDSWSKDPTNHDLRIHQHNSLIDPETNTLVLFGGYGWYQYSANLTKYCLNGQRWESVDLSDQIAPRYLASSAFDGKDALYVFGGLGSISGLQAQSMRSFYDLHRIDLRRNTSTLLGSIKEPEHRYVFGSSMVMIGSKLYALGNRNDVYNSALRLFEVDTTTFNYRIFNDSIPYYFHDVDSYSTLFRYRDSRLYAVVSQKSGDNSKLVSVYSLAYPVLDMKDVLQEARSMDYTIWIVCVVIVCACVAFVAWRRCRNVGNRRKRQLKNDAVVAREVVVPQQSSSVNLLGRFHVINRQGKDISESFTPVVRQLFLICILEYYSSGKGLTSKRLEDIIWYDMDKSNATNNRNVNIRKLRLLLQELDDVVLKKEDNLWQIHISANCYCDYRGLMALLNEVRQQKEIDRQTVAHIIEIALAGDLLPDFESEWADAYKSDFSQLLIDTLIRASRQEDIREDWRLLVSLSDVMLIHDNLDINAVSLKCRSLHQLGQKHLSKQCFEKYHSDYVSLLNEEPKIDYRTIVSSI